MSLTRNYFFSFLRKEQIAKDTYIFFFDRRGKIYDFLPGQYNRVSLPITPTDRLGPSRDFTISSPPFEKDIITITTKMGRSDFKKAFFGLKSGMKVKFTGPMGGFVLPNTIDSHHVFLAGGIGITPFFSMISFIVEKNLTIPITLLASFSTEHDIIYYHQLTKLAKNHDTIRIVYTITKPGEKHSFFENTGRISEAMIKKYIPEIFHATYYIVGSLSMVRDTEALLENMQISDDKIKIETFNGYE